MTRNKRVIYAAGFISSAVVVRGASACSVCFGATTPSVNLALQVAILLMLGVLLCVMVGVVAFFIQLRKRSKIAASSHH